jgi:hypothetical protein
MFCEIRRERLESIGINVSSILTGDPEDFIREGYTITQVRNAAAKGMDK